MKIESKFLDFSSNVSNHFKYVIHFDKSCVPVVRKNYDRWKRQMSCQSSKMIKVLSIILIRVTQRCVSVTTQIYYRKDLICKITCQVNQLTKYFLLH